MVRSELVAALAREHPDLSTSEIERIVSCLLDTIVERLARGGRVELRGFGVFSTRARDARVGRNPRTGDTVSVEAKRLPFFKPGKDMRKRLNVNRSCGEHVDLLDVSLSPRGLRRSRHDIVPVGDSLKTLMM